MSTVQNCGFEARRVFQAASRQLEGHLFAGIETPGDSNYCRAKQLANLAQAIHDALRGKTVPQTVRDACCIASTLADRALAELLDDPRSRVSVKQSKTAERIFLQIQIDGETITSI